jgi:hypothetical protein
MVKRASWLSVTPEPERVLPEAVATMLAGHRPGSGEVQRERAKVERLVLRGSQRQWLRYLHRVVDLIGGTGQLTDPDVIRARSIASAAIANHHNLLLALPGPGAAITAGDRSRLAQLQDWPESGRRTQTVNGNHHEDLR